MLWQIDGPRLALLGSVHMLDVPDPPLSDAAWGAFNTAERVVFEHDLFAQPDTSFARLPAGESLQAVVPPQVFAALQARCQELGLNTAFVSTHQPWFAALILVSTMAARAGLDINAGVDRKLWERARRQGKTIDFLEDAATALRTFSSIPAEEQQTMLRLPVLDPVTGVDYLRLLINGWKQRRADIILAYVQERMIALMPNLYGRVIEDRNRAWLPRLRALAESGGTTLVVVGALHTVGAAGIPALLRSSGCGVTAIDLSGE